MALDIIGDIKGLFTDKLYFRIEIHKKSFFPNNSNNDRAYLMLDGTDNMSIDMSPDISKCFMDDSHQVGESIQRLHGYCSNVLEAEEFYDHLNSGKMPLLFVTVLHCNSNNDLKEDTLKEIKESFGEDHRSVLRPLFLDSLDSADAIILTNTYDYNCVLESLEEMLKKHPKLISYSNVGCRLDLLSTWAKQEGEIHRCSIKVSLKDTSQEETLIKALHEVDSSLNIESFIKMGLYDLIFDLHGIPILTCALIVKIVGVLNNKPDIIYDYTISIGRKTPSVL